MTSAEVEVGGPEPVSLMEPIRAHERIITIDVLRGLALFGIIAANIRAFSGPAIVYIDPALLWPELADRLAQAFIDTFVQGKFIAIFSFLFGVGFAVQLSRAQARGGAFGNVYARRLAGLLVIGLIHGLLIWWGDILVPYALTGFLLFFFRKSSNLSVTLWAIILYLFPTILIVIVLLIPLLTGVPIPADPPPTPDDLESIVAIYAEGSWGEIQAQRAREAVRFNWTYSLIMIPNLLGLFLFGVLAWRKRIFEPPPASLPRYRKAMILGFAIGILANGAATTLRWFNPEPLMTPTISQLPAYLLQGIGNPALSVGYVALVILLCQQERWRSRLGRAGAVGRTALTNYLMQSVLATLLFYEYGLGLYGMGPAALLVPTIVIFAFQLLVSRWWIERFRFGPVEWLWRSITYGRVQQMRRVKSEE